LFSKGILDFRLPPYNPWGERMAANLLEPYFIFFLFFPSYFLRISIGLAWELHGEILWEGWMIGRQARPCMNLLGMYRWFGVVPQGLVVLFPGCSWWWFSEPSLGGFLGVFSGPCSWGFGGGNFWEPFMVFCPVIPLPNPWVKGLNFRVFGVLGLEEFLAGFLQILLIWQVWWTKSWLWTPHEVFLLCQSLDQVRGAIREIEIWIWRSWPAGAVHPELPRLHRSDRCSWPVWPVRVTRGICLGRTAWLVYLWVLVLLVSSWSIWSYFVRFCVGFSFLTGCVLGMFLFQGLEKSLRISGTFVVRLL
jgi:hypothetical protein